MDAEIKEVTGWASMHPGLTAGEQPQDKLSENQACFWERLRAREGDNRG